MAVGMAQVVELLSKFKALSSNPSTAKKKKSPSFYHFVFLLHDDDG
jgi:hypothetical protein